jgi:hypothetical protein
MSEQSVLKESILETVKQLIGLSKTYAAFDLDIVTHINSVFSNLTQMGVGPAEGFFINGYDEKWSDFVLSDATKTNQIKSYMALKVKSIFDPSPNATIVEATNRAINEMEYRLRVQEEGVTVIG